VINFSYKLKTKKPDTAIYLNALDALDIQPAEAIYIGDGNDSELNTAFELGFKTVLISQKRNDRFRNAESSKYHLEIKNISELINIINGD
ncbi:MAG TPA: HAD family hydrolase, partial [Firmicutes bacterium]|nr:HAD family hydrolase [Bacillota bacterium]